MQIFPIRNKMVVNSVLPNLLNVAQIVNIVTAPMNGQERGNQQIFVEFPLAGDGISSSSAQMQQQIDIIPAANGIKESGNKNKDNNFNNMIGGEGNKLLILSKGKITFPKQKQMAKY
jgi:hypothetical protein